MCIRDRHNGANTFAKYTFPEHKYTSPDGDISTLQALVTTSFNSTFPFMIAFGDNLRACNNGNVWLTGAIAMFKGRHTTGLDITSGAKAVGNALQVAQENHELFQQMYETPVTEDVVFRSNHWELLFWFSSSYSIEKPSSSDVISISRGL